ncbi:MAG: hypothetical protein IPK78_20780 [Rhodospirillales bacterium]|nr:hypothetical protein [Rhodospirillales bacterium]
MFGSTGNGATAVTITSIGGDVKNVDQTSAARLLPLQVLPGEKHAANGTALRSYSPNDIPDPGFAASAGADRPQRQQLQPSRTLTATRLVECSNPAAINLDRIDRWRVHLAGPDRLNRRPADHRLRQGVTLRLSAGKTAKTCLQYSVIALTKRGTDE